VACRRCKRASWAAGPCPARLLLAPAATPRRPPLPGLTHAAFEPNRAIAPHMIPGDRSFAAPWPPFVAASAGAAPPRRCSRTRLDSLANSTAPPPTAQPPLWASLPH
jgi:hypothetical protein